MRCKETRKLLEALLSDQLPESAREHLRTCAVCESYGQDWRLVRSGLRILSQEPVPDAPVGFVTRVTRRLAEPLLPGRIAAQFWELVGRRVVLAGSLLALTVLMAVVLLPSGPWQASTVLDLSVLQAGVVAESDPVVPDDTGRNQSIPSDTLRGEDRKGR